MLTLPVGLDPNAALLRIAASNCCSNCILAFSRSVLWPFVDVFAMFDQKPAMSSPLLIALPQRVLSATGPSVGPPGYHGVPFQTPSVISMWVAQKPWVRVVRLPAFSYRQSTVAPAARLVIVTVLLTLEGADTVVPPTPATVTEQP